MFNKNLVILLLGQSITMFGSAILKFALALYVLSTTGRSDYFALLIAISTIPLIVVTPLSGVIVDRVNKKKLMISIDFILAIVVGIFAFYINSNEPTLPVIGLIMVIMSCASAIVQPNSQAVLPLIVSEENIIKSTSFVSSIGSLSALVAPVLGGILYSIYGISMLVDITIVSFIIAVIIELFITIPMLGDGQKMTIKSLLQDFKEGVNYVTKENKFIFNVTALAAALNLFMTPLIIIGVPYILKVTLNVSDSLYGLSQTIIELSMVFGALSVSVLASKLKVSKMYKYLLFSCIGFIPILIATTPYVLAQDQLVSYILIILGTVIISADAIMISVYVIGLVQSDTPKHLLGKVMALLFTISQCAAPIGQILYGYLFEGFKELPYIPILIVLISTILIAIGSKKVLNKY